MKLHRVSSDNARLASLRATRGERSRTKRGNQGFTLVEILVVTALITTLLGTGMFVSFDYYRMSLINSERDLALHAFEKARNRSMNNIHEAPHGVHIASGSYTIFRGLTYAPSDPTNEIITSNSTVQKSGITDIVFSQLSGDPDTTGTLTLQSDARTRTISINNEGTIAW